MRSRFLFFCILLMIPTMFLTAQDAVLARVSGQVKVSADSVTWTVGEQGTVLEPGTVISTGFKSTALIKTADAEIEVSQLTRLTLEELTERDNTIHTTLFLNGGRINTEVSREKVRHDFTVRSPVATASVRGTGFSFDGRNLSVRHGSVLIQSGGRSVLTYRGDRVSVSVSGTPESRAGAMKRQTEVTALLTLAEGEEDETPVTGGSPARENLADEISTELADLSITVQ